MPATRIVRFMWIGILAMALAACSGAPSDEGNIPTGVSIYQAQDIDNRQIHFIWLELPTSLAMGSNEVRVFMARTDPPAMLVPTETELPCIVQSEDEYLEFGPVTLPFEFDGVQLEGSYVWSACPSCEDCYMDWDTTMEIIGTMDQDKMDLGIGIRHMGHNILDDFFRIELGPEQPTSMEPSIQCRRTADCMGVEFVPRQ